MNVNPFYEPSCSNQRHSLSWHIDLLAYLNEQGVTQSPCRNVSPVTTTDLMRTTGIAERLAVLSFETGTQVIE